MSATLGTLLKQLQPDWDIREYERLGDTAFKSSNPWNNASTGRSALCELNYTPVDLFASIRWHNLFPMIAAAVGNLSLVKHLISQLAAPKRTKSAELQQFFPDANPDDWYQITAGQRAQVIKKESNRVETGGQSSPSSASSAVVSCRQ